MPMRPVHLTAVGPRKQGRKVMWAAIRKLRRFTVPELRGETAINLATLRTYIEGLERAGYLIRCGVRASQEPGAPSPIFELSRDVGIEAPRVRRDGAEVRQGRGREQMWRTMKLLREFSARELALHASTAQTPVAEADAESYTRYLLKAGYLRVVKAARPGAKTRYMFVRARNSGPYPPMIQRSRCVFDPNLHRIVWPTEAQS